MGSCPASFRASARVILSSLSGTVVARDELLPVWADVEAAMALDLLGVAVRAASKELDDQALPAVRSHELGRRRVLLGDRGGCRRAMLPRRVGLCMVSTWPAR